MGFNLIWVAEFGWDHSGPPLVFDPAFSAASCMWNGALRLEEWNKLYCGLFPCTELWVSCGLTLYFQPLVLPKQCWAPGEVGLSCQLCPSEAVTRGALYGEGTSRDKRVFLPLVLSIAVFLEEKNQHNKLLLLYVLLLLSKHKSNVKSKI